MGEMQNLDEHQFAAKVKRRYMELLPYLLACYSLMLAFGTLFPIEAQYFSTNWMEWPRYNVYADNVVNIVLFFPIGLFGSSFTHKRAFVLTMIGGTSLSFTVESLQALLPTRFSSIGDFAFNIIGTFIGACCGRYLIGRWSRR